MMLVVGVPVNTIRVHTRVGQALEDLVERALVKAGFEYRRSPASSAVGYHEPDFVVDGRNGRLVLQVTSTLQPETFIKKRWRYMEQVAQTKAKEGPSTPCIAITFGEPANLQRAEKAMAHYVFDFVVWMRESVQSKEVEELLYEAIATDQPSLPDTSSLEEVLASRFSSFFQSAEEGCARSEMAPVWQFEHAARAERVARVGARSGWDLSESFLRRAFFKLAPFDEARLKELIARTSSPGTLDAQTLELCSLMRLEVSEMVIDGEYVLTDREVVSTIESGYTLGVHKILRSSLFRDNRYENLLADVADPDRSVRKAEIAMPLLLEPGREAYRTLVEDAFRNPGMWGFASERVWPVDIALAALGLSASELNRRYVARFGHFGVSNPVKNFIPRTSQALSALQDDKVLERFVGQLVGVLGAALDGRDTPPTVSMGAIGHRRMKRDSLFLQAYVNPTTELFLRHIESAGWSAESVTVDSALGLAEVPGRMKRVEGLFECRRGGEVRLAKVIAAYESGVHHKAIEMAGRRRLINFASSNSGPLRQQDLAPTHFIYEGVWNADHLAVLELAGWDHLESLWDVVGGGSWE